MSWSNIICCIVKDHKEVSNEVVCIILFKVRKYIMLWYAKIYSEK